MHRLYTKFSLFVRFLLNASLDIIAPHLCFACKDFLEKKDIFCNRCGANMFPIATTTLWVTDTRSMQVYAATAYQDPVKKLILAKRRSDRVAAQKLGDIIWTYTTIPYLEFDYIVPIPLHWSRKAWRGYNQAELIAQQLARNSGKQLAHILTRRYPTKYQSSLDADERHENVKNVFALTVQNRDSYKGSHIVLVDDLMTTGATLCAAAKVVYELRPARISVVVASRVV